MQEEKVIADLEVYLEQLVAGDQFSGAVLVAKDSSVLFKSAYGQASQAFGVPNQVHTKLNLGSMNKMFTAVAIAQLAEQGKLSFQDSISKRLPDYPRDIAEKVTIHHLLTHTSGMGSYWNEKFEASWARLRTVNDFLALSLGDPLSFEPGEQWQYSNAGFIVLGAIIEQVSGQSYFDYVREFIYTPAQMHDTDAFEMDQSVLNRAIGYTYAGSSDELRPKARRNNLFLHVVKGGPAGGGYSTVEDLLKFSLALSEHSLLTPEYTTTVLGGKVLMQDNLTLPMRYAYGFSDGSINDHRIVGHGGGAPGINGRLDMYLDLGYTVAVLANYDPPAAAQVADWLKERLTLA